MLTSPIRLTTISCALVATILPAALNAQQNVDEEIKARWIAALADAQKRVSAAPETASAEEKRATRREMYKTAIEKLALDDRLRRLEIADVSLVTEQTRAEDRELVKQLRTQNVENKAAKSVDSRSTNPITSGLAERSGFSDFIALALNSNGFLNANENAVTLNLNALALYSLADPEVYSELYRYQQHSGIRRLSGSITFGAKVPEKQITGISGLPDAEKLLDVFAWNVKVRLMGDRDARSQRWYPLTLGRGGLRVQIAALVPTLVPVEDAALVAELMQADLGGVVREIKSRIARSAQLSFKTSGTHLTKEEGKNKYSGELLLDAGLGPKADLTANLLYSVVDDVSLGAEKAFKVKKWTFNASLTTHFGENAIVNGRAVDWNTGFAVNVFQDKGALPIPVDNTWKLFTTFEIPVADAAKVPLSLVFSNDPNALTKQKYVSGFVGVNYDFSALGKLFKGN